MPIFVKRDRVKISFKWKGFSSISAILRKNKDLENDWIIKYLILLLDLNFELDIIRGMKAIILNSILIHIWNQEFEESLKKILKKRSVKRPK